jgi:hypothetical protein
VKSYVAFHSDMATIPNRVCSGIGFGVGLVASIILFRRASQTHPPPPFVHVAFCHRERLADCAGVRLRGRHGVRRLRPLVQPRSYPWRACAPRGVQNEVVDGLEARRVCMCPLRLSIPSPTCWSPVSTRIITLALNEHANVLEWNAISTFHDSAVRRRCIALPLANIDMIRSERRPELPCPPMFTLSEGCIALMESGRSMENLR